MARASKLEAAAFLAAPALEPSYSCIELVEYHSEPQRTRRSPVTITYSSFYYIRTWKNIEEYISNCLDR